MTDHAFSRGGQAAMESMEQLSLALQTAIRDYRIAPADGTLDFVDHQTGRLAREFGRTRRNRTATPKHCETAPEAPRASAKSSGSDAPYSWRVPLRYG